MTARVTPSRSAARTLRNTPRKNYSSEYASLPPIVKIFLRSDVKRDYRDTAEFKIKDSIGVIVHDTWEEDFNDRFVYWREHSKTYNS
ncbi:hypothetical protein KEM55_001502, partial [Ascosphaera atra]